MTVTIAELGTRVEEIVREVEEGHVVEVERDGKVVARISPAEEKRQRPWEALRGSAVFHGDPEDSVWFEHPGVKR